ncbi:MAG: type VI secretion system tip protein VgrG [Nitrospirae bacterium]|nr:type VI secretion system tip protein VgrG [Nitrospirota bacterium]
MPFTQDNRLIAVDTPLGKDVLLLTDFSGTEEISSLFHFHLSFYSENHNITFKDIIGQNVTVSFMLANGEKRFFNGIISRFSQGRGGGDTGGDTRFSSYTAELVPWLWLLTRTADSRIFQNLTVPDIVANIIQDNNFFDFQSMTKGNHPKREYCVQYRETDFNFISRLMEEEGIYYFFKHEQGKHTLVIADAPEEHQPCPNQETARYQISGGGLLEADTITVLDMTQEIRAGKYTLNDFNFETPNTSLKVETSSRQSYLPWEREIYDYPGKYGKRNEGDNVAKIRIEEEEAGILKINGSSSCRAFTSGYRFELQDYYRSDMNNKEYVLTALHHDARQEYIPGAESGLSYVNNFTCIPFDVPYRHPRHSPKPFVHGSQTAIVVGPSGEEIYTDKYGRVKVQFHWDRLGKNDENSSCWIRVSQVWAGTGWGAMFIPRIGQEVIVDFLEGDPDRPIITGRVYHGTNNPPYKLPDEKTKSTIKSNSSKGGGGFNEIRFEDEKYKEQLFIHAERDQHNRVKYDSREWIGFNRHLVVKNEQIELVEAHKHLSVKGDHNEKVEGTISVRAGMDIQEKADLKYALDAGQEIHLKAGMNIVLEAGAKFTIEAGGSFITVGPSGVDISGAKINLNSGGSPVAGSGCSPQAPKLPDEADTAKPGEQPQTQSAQAQTLRSAAKSGTPFCAT